MTKNEWFVNTFLKSLTNGQWLSAKQMQVCKRYMVQSVYYPDNFMIAVGDTCYTATQVSKKKGYGQIRIETFPYNVEERVTNLYGEQFKR